jgi:polyhydroxyalkanoate synthesis regulator phasin
LAFKAKPFPTDTILEIHKSYSIVKRNLQLKEEGRKVNTSKIEKRLKEIDEKLTTHDLHIPQLLQDVKSLKSDVDSLSEEVAKLQKKLRKLESKGAV